MAEDENLLKSLLASARRIVSERRSPSTKSPIKGTAEPADIAWQDRAWEMYDLVGEFRTIVRDVASLVARADIFVAKRQADGTFERVKDSRIADLVRPFRTGPDGTSANLYRIGVNHYVAGECWIVGVPHALLEADADADPRGVDSMTVLKYRDQVASIDPLTFPARFEDMDWFVLSQAEVSTEESADGVEEVTLTLPEGKVTAPVNDVHLVRSWEPHPRIHEEADSPTRASLPILEEIVGLSMRVSAQIDSRLAGAGLLLIPSEANERLKDDMGERLQEGEDPLVDSLIRAMLTPIKDRRSASAVVPLVLTMPAEHIKDAKHLTFADGLDAESRGLRDAAMGRLAIAQDAPPEVLLGKTGMNHWGAWLVQSENIDAHIAPRLAYLCTALTEQMLWPALLEQGVSDREDYVVWYDVEGLKTRPNRSGDAMSMFQAGAISHEALRRESGFAEKDAPTDQVKLDSVHQLALQMASNAPTLWQNPGLPELVNQLKAMLNGEEYVPLEAQGDEPPSRQPVPDPEEGVEDTDGGAIPRQEDDQAETPGGGEVT